MSATLHVQSEFARRIAFVTTPNSAADEPLLTHLRLNDSLIITETSAADANIDYSKYDLIVLGCVPNSGAAGFTPLKGYDKPMVLLKPFLLKNTVWNWGNAVNTQDIAISVTDASHPIFRGIEINNNELPLFTQCNTNAVTAISTWTNTTGYTLLGTPVSNNTYTTIAEFPNGTDCNSTILPQPLIMIGVSEYSTAQLTQGGKQLIENAILYLLGMEMSTDIEHISNAIPAEKFMRNGNIYIRTGQHIYTILGNPIQCL